jgi:hypothetical protein
MKKLFIIFILFSITFFPTSALAAATPTPTAIPTPTGNLLNGLDKQINNLKDRIASRVAQLNLVEKRGIIGTVTDISETQLTLSDLQGNIRFVDVDELTKFSSPSAKSNFGISDITKGSTVGVLGLFNKESHRILGRFVDVIVLPQVFSGAITAIDAKNYAFSFTTIDKNDYTVEIDTITKTYVYSPDSGLTKSGFSKLSQGERVMVIGFFDKNDKTKIVASRVLRLPTISVNPKIVIIKPEDLGVTPSTGSGNKLVPIIKVKQ